MNGLKLEAAPLTHALRAEKARRLGAARALGRDTAVKMEADARAYAPWRDRTGRARAAIRARAQERGGCVAIVLTSGAPYAAALEAGRYAVVGPTVRKNAPLLLRALAKEGGV